MVTVLALWVACSPGAPTEAPTGEPPPEPPDDTSPLAHTGAPHSAEGHSGEPGTVEECPDTDGDGVPDAAEELVTRTDPEVFDGGCLPWRLSTVDLNAPDVFDVFALGDLDGDGDLDVLESERGQTLLWFENRGGGSFSTERPLWNAPGSPVPAADGLAIADLDGDGRNDVVVAVSGVMRVLLGTGGGAFAAPAPIAEVAIGPIWGTDLDADGDADLLATLRGGLAWFENLGSTFEVHQLASGILFRVAPGDVDGDGDADLAYTETYAATVGWLENPGRPDAPWPDHRVGAFGRLAHGVVLADLDGDGDPDLAATGAERLVSRDELRTWGNDGRGSFSAPRTITTAPTVAAADLDGDGDEDLVTPDRAGMVWWVTEDGQLAPLTIGANPAGPVLSEPVLGDLDGDGRVDVARGAGVEWFRNPLGDDTDADGLTDDAETCILGTDPLLADTDGDGLDDRTEACEPTDPG